jgi:5-bromo-4-chloroindolyl phosphate hydrolysis protein
MSTHRSENEDEDDKAFFASLLTRETIGTTLFWFVLWAATGFSSGAGIGFFFAWAGSIGLFHNGKKKARKAAPDTDHRGFEPAKVAELANAPEVAAPPPIPLHRQVIADAEPARVRLEAAASAAGEPVGIRLRTMVTRVKDVIASLEADPSRLSDVQRLFTYYLPATADLLAARGALAGSGETARLAEIDTMIGKLGQAYDDFAARLSGHDARSLEIDMRLLDQALDQEFALKTKA